MSTWFGKLAVENHYTPSRSGPIPAEQADVDGRSSERHGFGMRYPRTSWTCTGTRKATYALLHSKMRSHRGHLQRQGQVPLPDMERDETARPSRTCSRRASIRWQVASPPSSPQSRSPRRRPGVRMYDRRAQDAARTIDGWWQDRPAPMLKMKQRGRRIIAYGMAPVVVRWNSRTTGPVVACPSPAGDVPVARPRAGEDEARRTASSRSSARSAGCIANGYADQRCSPSPTATTSTGTPSSPSIEYIDEDHTVLMAAGYYPNSTRTT